LNWRGVLKIIGSIEMVVGFLMLTVPLIDLLTFKPLSVEFLTTGILIIVVGYLSNIIEAPPISLIEGVFSISLAWVLISFEAAIPLMFALRISFIDALFESVSGFTGTGFTVLTGLDYMKPSIVTWRSIMQWSGELGVVVFAMLIFPYFYRYGSRAYGIERPVKIEASFYRTAQRLIMTYILFTGVGLILFIYTGMNFYEAFNHVLTAIATGGMSTYDNGYEVIYQRSHLTYIPVTLWMIIGGMNFVLLDRLIRGDFKSVVKSEEFQTYIYTMLTLIFVTILSYYLIEGYDVWTSITYGLFNQVSGMTTTGFNLGKIGDLKSFTKFTLIIGMFIGGMTFSTAGGIKTFRLLIILKKIKVASIANIVSSNFEKSIRVDGNIIDESEVSATLIYPIIHIFIVTLGAALMSIYGYSFIDTLFEATSAASCVGLSVGVVTPHSPVGVKIIIMILMMLGRIEYIQLYLLVGYIGGRNLIRVLK